MKNPQQTSLELVANLARLLDKGWKAYLAAQVVHHAHEKRGSDRSQFFDIVEAACLDSAILSLAELTNVEYKLYQSTSIYTLLDFSASKPHAFPNAGGINFREFAKARKDQLKALRPTIEKIKVQRDEIIAHLDEPQEASGNGPAHDTDEIMQVFSLILTMLANYKSFLGDPEEIVLPSKNLSKDLAKEIEGLLR
jgi:hypothetical protein